MTEDDLVHALRARDGGLSDDDVAAARSHVRGRLRRRRRTSVAGGIVLAALAFAGTAWVASRGASDRTDVMASGNEGPSSVPGPTDLPPGARVVQGVECGIVPAEAATLDLEISVTGPLRAAAPTRQRIRGDTTVRARNLGDERASLSGPGEITVALIDQDGAIASPPSPSLVAGMYDVEPLTTVNLPGALPVQSCDQRGFDRLAPGIYQVAPVTAVLTGDGEVTVVRGDLTPLTYE